jgi:hypothetical protein
VIFFVCGIWIGEAYALNFDEAFSAYNPVVYYRMMTKLQNSPFMWATPEMWYQIRDARAEFGFGALSLVMAGGSYIALGPTAAVKCLGMGATKSRVAAKAFQLHSHRGEVEEWWQKMRDESERNQTESFYRPSRKLKRAVENNVEAEASSVLVRGEDVGVCILCLDLGSWLGGFGPRMKLQTARALAAETQISQI